MSLLYAKPQTILIILTKKFNIIKYSRNFFPSRLLALMTFQLLFVSLYSLKYIPDFQIFSHITLFKILDEFFFFYFFTRNTDPSSYLQQEITCFLEYVNPSHTNKSSKFLIDCKSPLNEGRLKCKVQNNNKSIQNVLLKKIVQRAVATLY